MDDGDRDRGLENGRWLVPVSIIIAGAIIAMAIVYVNGGLRRGAATAGLPAAPPPAALPGAPSADDDPALGNPAAPVTIIEFSDFQCPFCRQFFRETLPRLNEQYIRAGRVRFVYRDFPLASIHELAATYAEAAECADDQGQFWAMHDKIFQEQDRRGAGTISGVTAADVKRWATEIGLDGAAFESCLDSGTHRAEVAKDFADGQAAGVTGTPTIFINGRSIVGALPFERFAREIDVALTERTKNP